MLPTIGSALDSPDGMEALRTAVGHLRADDPITDRARLAGAIAVFAAAWARRQQNQQPVPPQPKLSHAADVLHMLSGTLPDAARVRGLDAYLCCVVDHGMNASTFTARVVASTASDLISAVVAAICALKGPLHGGAPGPVLDMLDAIGRPERARAWLEQEIGAGRRIMGMGHRIYRVRDPRAAALESATTALERSGIAADRLAIAVESDDVPVTPLGGEPPRLERADLVARENSEITVLQQYLPAQMGAAEVDALIAEAIAASGATSIKDMGKVMALVKPKAAGRTDMGAVSARIKQKLS
jgi:citrate synthase